MPQGDGHSPIVRGGSPLRKELIDRIVEAAPTIQGGLGEEERREEFRNAPNLEPGILIAPNVAAIGLSPSKEGACDGSVWTSLGVVG
jgi:hypothetical protein